MNVHLLQKKCSHNLLSTMQDATVRKLYRQVRRVLKVTSAIKLAMGSGASKKGIPKSDEKINTVGISNCCELFVLVLQEPDIFQVLLKMPSPIGNKTINIAEVSSIAHSV